MKKFLLVLLALALGATSAFSYLGQVVGSFESPDTGIVGLAISSDCLYALRGYIPFNRVYRLNPLTGSVKGTFRLPGTTDYFWGLAYSAGGYIWASDLENRYVYRVNATSGSVYGRWRTSYHPCGLAPRCTGDGGEGTYRIIGLDSSANRVLIHGLTGSVYASFETAYPSSNDIAYDWRNDVVWVVNDEDPYQVYGYKRNGSILASFANPDPALNYYALAYRGGYLWISCDTYRAEHIFRVHCPGGIGVAPASLGKVKALFR